MKQKFILTALDVGAANTSNNERGFMLLSAIFLTLIVSIMAMLFMNANLKVKQRESTLYYTAANIANEQFAMLESLAARGEISTLCNVSPEDLKSYNGVDENSQPIEFNVSCTIEKSYGNLREYKVTVKWNVNEEMKTFETSKTIRIVPKIFNEEKPNETE